MWLVEAAVLLVNLNSSAGGFLAFLQARGFTMRGCCWGLGYGFLMALGVVDRDLAALVILLMVRFLVSEKSERKVKNFG